MNPDYKKELLSMTLDARIKEVTEYQVNIDNFKIALEMIDPNDGELSSFREQLENLLKSNVFEQRKAIIMLEVVRKQLEE